ncbi:hypothetical protein KY284_004566 [Solanum tuberosum]|nr:hypothetical protein KY284_004566 [Solanum tuberosum]
MSLEKEYMQVNTSFHPSTKQAKQYIHDVETRASENIVKSSQGLPSVDKNTLFLEKENTQVKSPSSIAQVMQPFQTTRTYGKRLKVSFYNNQTVGTNSNLFSRHLGKFIRDCNMCPRGVSSWSDIKQRKLDHMWAAIMGGKDGNPPNLATIFFETLKNDNMLVELEAIEKHVRLAQKEENTKSCAISV